MSIREDFFKKNGALSRALSAYEPRQQQEDLSSFIEESIASGGVCLSEAGTGTGKTLAYLVPLALNCVENGVRGAVSTETKNLQSQLLEKDFPLVRKILKDEYGIVVKAALCLGSGNYFCRRRFLEMINEGKIPLGADPEEIFLLSTVAEQDEIHTIFTVDVSRQLWNECSRISDYCTGPKCRNYEYCSFTMAREEWKNADILIMNHSLFFANVALGKNYLPKFNHVIFDEAHNLEQIACEQLGFTISESFIREVLSIIHHRGRKELFESITDKATAKNVEELITRIDRNNSVFFGQLKERGAFASRQSERLKQPLGLGSELIESLDEYPRLFERIEEQCDNESAFFLDFKVIKETYFNARQALSMSCDRFEQDWAYWIEYGEKNNPFIKGLPLDISSSMADNVYAYYESVSMISATLSVNGDFSFFRKSLGIADAAEITLGSPFDFEKNMLIYIPEFFPVPADSAFPAQCANTVAKVSDLTDGNTLALFTSYDAMNRVKKHLENLTSRKIFSQGDSDALRALSQFRKNSGSILLGTHSFWQGVDLPGDLLRSIIITRLPFLPPERPDVEAKSELYEKRGMNPFAAYHLPLAVIKFRQGMGRLIRSKNDKGIAAVLDSRILTKSYGQLFLAALPGGALAHDESELMKNAHKVT